MTSEDKGRRKIRPGAIEADPKEMAILVHYEAEEIADGAVVLTSCGQHFVCFEPC